MKFWKKLTTASKKNLIFNSEPVFNKKIRKN